MGQQAQREHALGLPLAGKLSTLTTVGHGSLEAVQGLLVLTQVIGHVPISVDCQKICTTAGKTDGSLASGPFFIHHAPHSGNP
jgi:hypothetical protein